MKSYTSIEQSKKLVELGLGFNTADMSYPRELYLGESEYPVVIADGFKVDWTKALPCWSLGALLELIPLTIEEEENKRYHLEIRGLDYNEGYSICHTDPHGFLTIERQCLSKSLIGATYNYICWLLENNLIQT